MRPGRGRALWFFMKNRRIVAVHGIRHKGQAMPARDVATARERMRDWRKRAGR
ncbi:MAG: type II toxin-antitoxin system RelE/ParE family toxin [candidate division NC10 bacterium]|nr:type II toxin-antitoxin system RelE/ParE family toxin [candidate division NC10 bacterium]